MKQTAVDWYEKEINSLFIKYETNEISGRDFLIRKKNLLDEAKEMEFEQIVDAYEFGGSNQYAIDYLACQYYKETYEGDE